MGDELDDADELDNILVLVVVFGIGAFGVDDLGTGTGNREDLGTGTEEVFNGECTLPPLRPLDTLLQSSPMLASSSGSL